VEQINETKNENFSPQRRKDRNENLLKMQGGLVSLRSLRLSAVNNWFGFFSFCTSKILNETPR